MSTTPIIKFGEMRPTRYPGILSSTSCSVNGYSTWGQRLECTGCGAVDESTSGSSVSWEDAPGRFAWAHRECQTVELDAFGRHVA